MDKGTWKVVLKEEIPGNSNVLNGRFVLVIKNKGTNEEIYKARFVVQGHRDREKHFLVHDSPNLRQSSTRLLVAIAAIFGFRRWIHDVRQAYLQPSEKLMRKVYLNPSKEFELSEGELLELLKPLYGLSDSGDYWHRTITRHLTKDMEMNTTVGELSLFIKHVDKKLIGMTGIYVDDSLLCGNDEFLKASDKSLETFESREREMDNTLFAGVKVTTVEAGFELSQKHYTKSLRILPKGCNFSDFRALLHKLAWLTHTRPEICCAVNMAAQVTDKSFGEDGITELNRVVTHVQKHPDQPLKNMRFASESLRIKVYADSSFANNRDNSSQIGYIILLVDKFANCNILHYSSHKSRRVTRSVLGAELYAFADSFHVAYMLKHDLQSIMKRHIPLTMLTDSKSLFNVITKCSSTSEKRLMIDICALREAYASQEISDVGFIATKNNPADAFTKVTKCQALQHIVSTGSCDLPIEQWVIRKNPFDSRKYSTTEVGV